MILTEGQKKFTASIFIGSGLLMIVPGAGDAFVNIPLADYITSQTGYSFVTSLIFTYTLIPFVLIWIGSLIYPKYKAPHIIRRHHRRFSEGVKAYLSNLRRDRNTQFLTLIILMALYNIVKVKFGG